MKDREFQNLKEVRKESDFDNIKKGDFFLYGDSIIEQKHKKKENQQITYYQMVKKEGKTINYRPVYDILVK